MPVAPTVAWLRNLTFPFLAGTVLLWAAAQVCQATIPAVAGHPNLSLRAGDDWAIRGLLWVNMAWPALLGAIALVATTRLAKDHRRLAILGATLLVTGLGLPSLMGASELLTQYRWPIAAGLALGAAATFRILAAVLPRVLGAGVLPRSAAGVVAGALAIGLSWAFVDLSSSPFAKQYVSLVLLVAACAQAAWYGLFVVSGAHAWLARSQVPGRLVAGSGAALIVVALLDPLGALDTLEGARIGGIVRLYCPTTGAIVRLRSTARRERHKIQAVIAPGSARWAPVDPSRLPAEVAPQQRHHVILFVIDALRRDHVGAYGHPGGLTPNLDRLARAGALYERAYSPSPSTGQSIGALLSGLPPQVVAQLDRPPLFVPQLLRHHGWQAATSATAKQLQLHGYPVLDGQQMSDIGLRSLGPVKRKGALRRDHKHVSDLLQRLRTATTPRFEYVHLLAAHGPFHGKNGRARYHKRIRQLDGELGRLMRFLDDKGLWSKTVLAVLADHGEALGEHGMFAHAQALYEEQVAVPLVVRSPGSIARRFPDPLTITALPEIVLRALGGRWPVAHSMPPKDDSAAVAVQEMNIGRHLAWRSLRTRRWAYHNRQMEGTTSLYDVVADPGELDDRAADEPARLAEFRALEERFESWEAQTVSGVDGLPRSARPTSPR